MRKEPRKWRAKRLSPSLKSTVGVIGLLWLSLAPASGAVAGEKIYRHPNLDFEFKAPDGWENVGHPEDGLIYEVKDPETGLRVMLWYTTTEQDCPGYLEKMADMKGFRAEMPAERRIGNSNGWIIETVGDVYGQSSRVTLAGVSRPGSYAEENALYIVQIWCPGEKYDEVSQQMTDILASVRVTAEASPLFAAPASIRSAVSRNP
jgi:hypothetical protein